jgi:CheY-like chemotaxis protein
MLLIALTGYGQDTDRAQAMEAGFDAHLLKPVDVDILCNLISEHCGSNSIQST